MANISSLAQGKNAVTGNLRHVQNQYRILDCSKLDEGLFEKSGLTKLAANDVHAVIRIPANSKIISCGIRILKAEGAARTITILQRKAADFGAVATLKENLDANSVGETDIVAANMGYSVDESIITITPNADMTNAVILIDVQYIVFDQSIANRT